MPSAFKKSIRGLLASVRSSIMDATGASLDDTIKKILTHQHARGWADSAFSCIIKSGDGSALLHALQNDVRVYKVSHYKKRPRLVFKDGVEHEFVIVHLRHGHQEWILRLDRSVGPKRLMKGGSYTKDTEKSPEVDDGSGKPHSPASSSDSPSSSRVSSSRSSSSIGSIIMYPALIVDYCVCRMSNIASQERWARDTVVHIPKVPSNCYELKTIEYAGSSPSLWDLVHIVEFVHKQCDNYYTIDAQCYWFADTVMALLEDWGKDRTLTKHHGWQGIRSKILSIPDPGTFKGVKIYERDVTVIETQKADLTKYIKESTQLTVERLDALKGGDLKLRRMQGQLQAEADAQVEAVSKQLREAEERAREAEERAERAEGRASDVETQLQEVLKTVEARATHTDALMARIMARLDDQSCHGPSVIV